MYLLSDDEKERLKDGIRAAFAIPFIDDVEDFIWEVVFSHVKQIPLSATLSHVRNKLLFDVVDPGAGIGWSAKSIQKNPVVGSAFEVVIQRADILKKAENLGFSGLTLDSSEQQLGYALCTHWYDEKVRRDAQTQSVSDLRTCILLKSTNKRKYAYLEEDLRIYSKTELTWRWTDSSKTGLQGSRKTDGFVVFRWYPNQKQLFERFVLPETAYFFDLDPRRLPLNKVIDLLLEGLDNP